MTTATIDFFLEIPLLSAFCLVSLFLPCNLSFNVFFPIGFSPSSWMNSRAASSFSPLYNILPSSVFLSLSLMITLKLLQNFAISFRSYLLTLSITRFLFFSPISFQCSKRWDTWQYIELERKEFSPWQILLLLSSTAVFILWQKKWTDGFDLFFFQLHRSCCVYGHPSSEKAGLLQSNSWSIFLSDDESMLLLVSEVWWTPAVQWWNGWIQLWVSQSL